MKNFKQNFVIIFAVLISLAVFISLTYYGTKSQRDSSKSAFEKISKMKIETTFGVDNITLPIFTFHYVEAVKNKDDFIRKNLSITPASFENNLNMLKNKG